MDFVWSRLRRGEIIVGVSGLVLLASMLLLPWYEVKIASGPPSTIIVSTSVNGWHGLAHGHWAILLAVLAAATLVFLQATRRAPALPVSASVAVTIFAAISLVWLIVRVLISTPGSVKAGAIIGLIAGAALLGGGYLSMRDEAPAPGQTEVRLASPGREGAT